jgi:Tfp pilus assembly protein PilN
MHLLPVDDIDFLPAGFHDRRRRKRARGRLWVVAAVLAGAAALGVAGSRVRHARIEAERDRLKPQAQAVADLSRQLSELRTRIDHAGLQADLRARLRLRSSTTRLLAAVAAPLPKHTALTELTLGRDRTPDAPTSPQTDAEKAALPPARRDLDRLTVEADKRRQTLTIRGITADDATVSEYLAALGRSALFDDVRLLFTDRHDHHGHDLRAFAVQLRVRPAAAPPNPSVAAIEGAAR